MKIATILPFKHLSLEAGSDYHMFLAHLMDNPEYAAFAKWQAARGAFTMLDNGVVETGVPLHIYQLMRLAKDCGITEMTLPDKINDRVETRQLHSSAMEMLENYNPGQKVMVIPQGATRSEWVESVIDMLALAHEYPKQITAIGISKFCVNKTREDLRSKLFDSRLEALKAMPKSSSLKLDIHLLGCPDHPNEINQIRWACPRVRGVDSGLPVFYTLHDLELTESSTRPVGKELNFNAEFKAECLTLLKHNISTWKALINPPR